MLKRILLLVACVSLSGLCHANTGDSIPGIEANGPIHKVKVSAYTNVASCTDSTPDITASLLRITPRHYGKVIALSRDLARQYDFGDKFYLWIRGEWHLVEFQDVMHHRFRKSIDFLLPSVKQCRRFGVKRGILIPLKN